MDWMITVVSLIATIANIHKKRWCFYAWAGTNAAWAFIDFQAGIYSQATLQAIYFGLAVWGIWKWK